MVQMWLSKATEYPGLETIIVRVLQSLPSEKMAFILDPTSDADIILLTQQYGQPFLDMLFYMIRTYVYTLHRRKLIIVGQWPQYQG